MTTRRHFLALLASPALPSIPVATSVAPLYPSGFTLAGATVLGSCLMMVNGDTLLRRYNGEGDLIAEQLIKGNRVFEDLPWEKLNASD